MGKKKSKKCSFTRWIRSKYVIKNDEEMFKGATKYIKAFKDIPYVFNLGHGLLPETDPDKVEKLVKFYRNFNG